MKRIASIYFILFLCLAFNNEIQAARHPLYAVDPPVHQWIALQAYKLLQIKGAPSELLNELASHMPTGESDYYYYSHDFDSPPSWKTSEDDPGQIGTSLIEGAWEEDEGWYVFFFNWKFPLRPLTHFWNPDGGYDAGLDPYFELGVQPSALKVAQSYFANALYYYAMNRAEYAYYYLGRTAHLLMDMSVPAHTLLDPHLPLLDADNYESFTAKPDNLKSVKASNPHAQVGHNEG